jgi:spore coat protein JC
MWNYEKRLQYPVNITTPNAKMAQIIMSQYGGPDVKYIWYYVLIKYKSN